MPRSNTGALGENAAADFLSHKGYSIVERNYRSRFGEIDIIAQNARFIIFTEVKTRKRGSMLLPREAVDAKKQYRIIMTAKQYISCRNIGSLQPRFDVIEVTTEGVSFEINHIENAFTL